MGAWSPEQKKDEIRNEHVSGSGKVEPESKKITERSRKWYGHDIRRDDRHMLRIINQYREETEIEEDRKPGGKTCERDMESLGLKEGDALDRTKWKEKR